MGMTALQEDWSVLVELFPVDWLRLGRSTGAVSRLRGFNSLNDLLRTLLMHVGCGLSLRETAVHAKLAGIADVSDVTLLNRLRQSEGWLRQLCQQMWHESGVNLVPAFDGRPLRAIDATVVREPGKTGGQWRIHYSLRLPTLECDHFELTPTRGKNTGERLGRFVFQPGELVLADAGYSTVQGIAAVSAQQAYLCVRLNPASVPLWDEQRLPFNLREKIRMLNAAGRCADWPVCVQSGGEWIAGRLCAIRKSEQAVEKAHRQLKRKQQRGRGLDTPEARELACYVLVLTTLPSEEASARQVLESYRLRWQVELMFKKLKTVVQLGHVPKHDEQSTRAWLYGKMFVALLSQRLAHIGSAISPWGYTLPQERAVP